MKKIMYTLAFISLIASCQNAPEGESAAVAEKKEAANTAGGTTYNVENEKSSVTFIGTKPVGTHAVLVHTTQGSIQVDNGNITGGSFAIDLSKMESKDADTNYSFKLIGHLQSPDFFDIAKYPNAKFEITACEVLANDSLNTHKISGNLTLKDSTKNVTFPAKVTLSETGLTAISEFIIDRTQWGLHYGNDKSLKDKFIYPEVKLMLNIVANK